MGDGIIDRGSSGVLQSREATGKYGRRALEKEKDEIEVRSERDPEPVKVPRSKLPTQANRTTRGPEVVG